MKQNNLEIEKYRDPLRGGDASFGNNGVFMIPLKRGWLQVIASDGLSWDHVSVSTPSRCPTWDEMCMVKDLFFDKEETVVQYHPPKSEYVNYHPYCLHLWRHQAVDPLLPPSILIGPKTGATA